MNFEYKVGYHWKYIGKDPGQQSWNGRKLNKTARTDHPIRPSGFCDWTGDSAPCFAAVGGVKSAFCTFLRCLELRTSMVLNHFSFFLLFFFFPFSSLLFLFFFFSCLLDLRFRGCSSARFEKVKAWKLSGSAESFADKCRRLRAEVSDQIQAKFCKNQLRLQAS